MIEPRRIAAIAPARYLADTFGVNLGGSIAGTLLPSRIVALEITQTKKSYARYCTTVSPAWLPDIAPQYFSYGAPVAVRFIKERGEAIVRKSVMQRNGPIVGERLDLVPANEACATERVGMIVAGEST